MRKMESFPLETWPWTKSGNLYGATTNGGDTKCGNDGCGVIYKFASSTLSVLHAFAGGSSDGAFPAAGPILDSRGVLYGTTSLGGQGTIGAGTLFRITPAGALTVIPLSDAKGQPDGP